MITYKDLVIFLPTQIEALKEIAYVYRQLQEAHQTTDTAAYQLAREISSL